MSKRRILVGIDPDVDKNGVAINNCGKVELLNLKFFELFDKLSELKNSGISVMVIVEGGWLNKSNWHKDKKGTAAVNAKIGNNTGRNHEVGRKIVEMVQYFKLSHVTVKPTQQKINAKLFKMMTKIEGKTNQEQRDAYMLIHGL